MHRARQDASNSLLRFGPFELDLTSGELRKDRQPVKLQPQPARVLGLLAANAGRLVTREEIYTQVWSGGTFVDFEQGLNYCIKQIRTALGDAAKSPTYVQTLQRRGYRFLSTVERGPAAAAAPGKLVLAVRPFENLSGDPEQEYFSDGLTVEMIAQLSRLNPARLGVIARTSAMKYKSSDKSVSQIARELGAAYVLEGSVRRFGTRARVTAELIEADDETHVWAETYERDFDDLLSVQRDVARSIAREINVTLTPGEARRLAGVTSVSPRAYEAYLKGRYFWHKRTEEAFRKGIDYFHEAIAHDPRCAAAYDGLSDSYVMLACRGVLPARETFQKAKEAARKALEIDDTLGEAHASLAHVRLHDWDWEGLEHDFRRALELNPGHAIAYYWYAEYLMAMGRPTESIAMARTAHQMDPVASVLSAALGMILYLARRFDEARECLQRALDLDNHFLLHFRLAFVDLQSARTEQAIEGMRQAVALSGNSTETLTGLAQACATAGRTTEMASIVDRLTGEGETRYVSPYNLARVYAAARHAERAFDWLERAFNEHNPDLIELTMDPVFDALRIDPRFADLVKRVFGLLPSA
jgi:TolB-like protein/Flp pilus assembly protein TadD